VDIKKKLQIFKYLAPPWGQNLYPTDNEKHNFGRRLPAVHHHAFSFSFSFFFFLHSCSFKEEDFLRIGHF
jgi:hypothetical protein